MKLIHKASEVVRQVLNFGFKLLSHAGHVNYKNQGLINLIDVGAIGELPHPWFKNARFVKNLIRFEPRESASNQPNVISLDYAVANKNETRPFYIYQGNYSHGSSLYEQNYEFVKTNFDKLKHIGPPKLAKTWFERSKLLKTLQVNCRSLDSILDTIDTKYDFLKIDAQGAEYEILVGAEKFLQEDCLGLQLEMFNLPMYKGIKLKIDLVKYLSEKGFELVKEMPPHGTFNCACDGVFLKKEFSPAQHEKMNLLRSIYEL